MRFQLPTSTGWQPLDVFQAIQRFLSGSTLVDLSNLSTSKPSGHFFCDHIFFLQFPRGFGPLPGKGVRGFRGQTVLVWISFLLWAHPSSDRARRRRATIPIGLCTGIRIHGQTLLCILHREVGSTSFKRRIGPAKFDKDPEGRRKVMSKGLGP